jgi:transglutaminase-like putative cysteine protease
MMRTAPAELELEVLHGTRYEYSAPVAAAEHLAHLKPLQDEHQTLLAYSLRLTPDDEARHEALDPRGNHACWFSLNQAHRELDVLARSVLRVGARFERLMAADSPAWDRLAQGLRYVAGAPFNAAVEYTLPSAYVPRLPVLREWAAPSLTSGRPVAEAALHLMERLHHDFAYDSGSTEVDTPLAQAFAQRRGVCQDFAHLLIGALRMHGVPARYVSGYLLTQAADDVPALLGADATHAWVQVYCPDTAGVPEAAPQDGWLDLDPTNNLVPGAGHVRLAVGRDYGDVAPLRGVIRGGGRHRLSVAVHTRVLGAPAAVRAALA